MDDDDAAAAVARVMSDAGMDASVARTGADGLAAAARCKPDVVLLDPHLPDVDGLDLLADLRDVAPVIVLTDDASEESIVSGLRSGAEDYVVTPCSPRVLVARVEVAARRARGSIRRRIEREGLVLDLDARTATLHGEPLGLTRRELDLLAHLAERDGAVVTRDELLVAVWRSTSEWQAPSTVTEHVRRVRQKLGDPRWIEAVRGVGYRFGVPA